MAIDAVQRALIVNPKPDSQDNARREHRQGESAQGQGSQPEQDTGNGTDSKPLPNAYGQIIGKTINIAV